MKAAFALAAVGGLLAGVVSAASPVAQDGQGVESPRLLSRHAAVKQLVLKFGPKAAAEQGVGIYRWADNMVPLFKSADIHNLNKALSAKNHTDMVLTMTGGKAVSAGKLPGGITPASLGSLTSDLVYTPLPSCILVDTRFAGGSFGAGVLRHYKASGPSFAAQGGSDTNCGIPAGVNALVVTVQSISALVKGGFRLWPYGTPMPTAAVVSYGPTQSTQNNIVLATTVGDVADFTAQTTQGGSHLVVAVMGYFAAPIATKLDCTQEVGDAEPVAAGDVGVASVACPAGYALTGGGAISSAGMPVHSSFAFGSWVVQAENTTASAKNLTAIAECCRVPGR